MVVRQRAGALAMLIALIAVALGGCFLPIFDLETSLAYQTASKMDKVGTIGPLGISEDRIAGASEYYYVPSRMLGPFHGLLVVADESGMSFAYLAPDPSNNNEIREVQNESRFFENGDITRFGYTVAPLFNTAAPPPDDAYFIAFASGDDAEIEVWGFDLAGQSFSQADVDTVGGITPPATYPPAVTLAVALDPATPPGNAPLTIFTRDSSPTKVDFYDGIVTDVTLPAGPLASVPTSDLPSGFSPTGGVGVYDAITGVYVYSNHAAGGLYNVYRWTFAAPDPELLPVRQSIHAILESGELYHRGANSDEVYDSSGKKKYSIPTGKLHFAYENTDGSEPVMFYTLVYFDRVEGDDDNMYIDIYAIPTADLGELD